MKEWKYGRPVVGVGALCLHQGNVLMVRRSGPHGTGTWSPPGGWLELGESIFDAVRREALEETGIQLRPKLLLPPTNNIFESEAVHSITCWVLCEYVAGEPQVMEPEKCPEVRWVPSPEVWDIYHADRLFLPMKLLVEREGAGYFGTRTEPKNVVAPAPKVPIHAAPSAP